MVVQRNCAAKVFVLAVLGHTLVVKQLWFTEAGIQIFNHSAWTCISIIERMESALTQVRFLENTIWRAEQLPIFCLAPMVGWGNGGLKIARLKGNKLKDLTHNVKEYACKRPCKRSAHIPQEALQGSLLKRKTSARILAGSMRDPCGILVGFLRVSWRAPGKNGKELGPGKTPKKIK